jgi:putative nucleotidyltransferase with HDIG domain
MMVVDHAARRKNQSENSRVFMWAALLHDLGKAPTTKVRKGRITAYDHDRIGAKMAVDFLKELTRESDFIKKVSSLVRWHMQILFVVKDLEFADLAGMATEISVYEMTLLSLCDRLGRGSLPQEKIEKECENIRIFLRKCEEYLNQNGFDYAVRPLEFQCTTD